MTDGPISSSIVSELLLLHFLLGYVTALVVLGLFVAALALRLYL